MKFHGKKLYVALAMMLVASTAAAQTAVDPGLPVYPRTENLKGNVVMVGSYTMSQLGAVWADSFQKLYPEVEIKIDPKGSKNAVSSVISGEASFGLLSRQITEEEVKAFHDKFGYLPTVVTPALEPIAIYVHKDNPIESLSLAQLDAIFSKTLKRGASKTATTWGDLGAAGKWAATPITCEARKDETGSQVFFQAAILGNGEFRDDVKEHVSNLELVKSVATTPGAIGFGGASFVTPDVKAIALKWRDEDPAIKITEANYPLVRPLQIVINRDPNAQLSENQREFLKFVFSQKGQQDVILGGFVPVQARAAQIALDAVDLRILN
ncbi:PstS family phosphate ABC transporter substrate-binding protein [Planctomicrobium sp. SH661]|uniref:PstS family phosphate ABC transporter substrate-binding protein n=1 Tax=Planctomicrobium sp. SH661 TaxID=3448124 RepID=UPI003F5B982B